MCKTLVTLTPGKIVRIFVGEIDKAKLKAPARLHIAPMGW